MEFSHRKGVLLSLFVLCYALFSFISVCQAQDQPPFDTTPEPAPKRVAIIGAGAAGSSAAYSLRKQADSTQQPVNITVFERSSYIGGRSTTVNVFNNPAYRVELGASIFVKVNHNLVNASRDLGLFPQSASYARPRESEDSIGIWDGEQFAFVIQDTSSWWNIAKLIWRYGLAPVRTQNLMKSTVNKFLKLYQEPLFPFHSLSEAAQEAGLLDVTASPGDMFLTQNSISADFSREIIQASTRVNYGQNLGLIHGLESMVCMATEGAVSIPGGNWQIFAGMLQSAKADIKLNHTVTSITRNSNNTWTVSFQANQEAQQHLPFDEVVIAGPYQYSGISVTPPLDQPPAKIPFVTLHVTLFSSPHKLSPEYFGLDSKAQAPETILTTLPRGTDLGSSQKGVGLAGFWSISTLRTAFPPPSSSPSSSSEEEEDSKPHYVYKVFSPERLTATFIQHILGLPTHTTTDTNTNANANANATGGTIGDIPTDDISWFHEKTWNPYPFLYPRVTFEETVLAPNLWYTGGIESFISTMETSAHMGKNVAALMFRAWQGDDQDQNMDTRPTGEHDGYNERTEL